MHKYSQVATVSAQFFQKYSTVFVLSICILTGCLLRTGTLAFVNISPESLFLFDTPLLVNLDGYYYLNNAKLLLDNSYSSLDLKRAYPSGAELPEVAPLLSYLVAVIAKITGVDINWPGAILPPILSLLICFPVYFFGVKYGGKITAYFAVCITLTSYIYATRTSIGLLDTDCMNVTFPLLIAYFFFKFGSVISFRRYIYFITGLIFFVLFLWWWDMAPSAVILFAAFPLLITLVFFYRPSPKEGAVFYACLALLVVLSAFFIGSDHIHSLFFQFKRFFLYITKDTNLSAIFPNTGVSNLEQEGLEFYEAAANTVGNRFFLVLSFIGLFLLSIQKPKIFLYILPTFVVGMFSFSSVRFLIFLTPVIAIGFGYLASCISKLIANKIAKVVLFSAVGVFMLLQGIVEPPFRTSFYKPEVIEGMHRIKKLTPPSSVIYSWWDVGHLLIYWSDRATLADGKMHESERTVHLAIPLITDNYKFAANYITFFATRGIDGVRFFREKLNSNHEMAMASLNEIFSNGPEALNDFLEKTALNDVIPPSSSADWMDFFFPKNPPPIYLFLEDRLLKPAVQRWIYWYGTWNTKQKRGDRVLQSIHLTPFQYKKGALKSKRIRLDEETGILEMNEAFGKPFQLDRITWFENGQLQIKHYSDSQPAQPIKHDVLSAYQPEKDDQKYFTDEGRYSLELFPPPMPPILQDVKLVNSLAKQLLLYQDSKCAPYFILRDEKRLLYQLWEVRGDRYVE